MRPRLGRLGNRPVLCCLPLIRAGCPRLPNPNNSNMSTQTAAEHELAELIVTSLNLEQHKAEDIVPEAPLFGGELGLDSIDALELALAISKRYGVTLRSDSGDNQRIFSSLRALSAHIESSRAPA
jgi:acyl carrier protein